MEQERLSKEEAQKVLMKARDWAKGKLRGKSEPPWAWYQYMKLVEVTEEILASQKVVKVGAVAKKVDLQKEEQHPEIPIPNKAEVDLQDSALSSDVVPLPVRLPM